MDFFGAQDHARRNTWRLAALFTLAVVCLVVLTNVLIAIVYGWASHHLQPGRFDLTALLQGMPLHYWLAISAGVLGVVGLASGVRYLQVRRGGRTIAEALGGRLISPSTSDFRERRLLNVVEEMAIASGMAVPPVYLIEESSINAFAAGFGPDDAVIGVNRGTLEHLNRDELQGVIGHEFSHLLNGDSRINLRLVAVLHGILFLGLLGRGLLYGLGRGRHRRGRGSGAAPALALGVGLLVIGYAGTFFGNLIKAAVSRQRELLADAASVQFTRNPEGIAGALKKIGAASAGSTMRTAAAREVSHMFFGQAQKFLLNRLMSTHPPLATRIRAVDPQWDGSYPSLAAPAAEVPSAAAATAAGGSALAGGEALEIHASPDDVVRAVGRLDQAALDQAGTLLGSVEAALKAAARDPFTARALMYALVLDPPPARERQLQHLGQHAERGLTRELERLLPLIEDLDEQRRLTLVEIAIPALKELSEPQYRAFVGNLVTLIRSDRRIDLMEWVLHRLLLKDLRPHFEGRARQSVRHQRLSALAAEAAELISALAREAASGDAERTAAFRAGQAALGLEAEPNTADDPNFARLNRALAELRALPPLQKPRLIKACAATVLANGRVSAREGALLQGIAATLDCPLPPSIYARRRQDGSPQR